MSNKKIQGVLAGAAIVGLTTAGAKAAMFTAGDVVVTQVGATGSGAILTSAGTAVFLDEYSPAGALVQSIPLPTATFGTNNPFVNSGTAGSEGALSLSGNGQSLLLSGYDAAVGTTNGSTGSIAGSPSTTIPREIAIVDGNGNVNTSTTTAAFSANNPRGVASQDGVNLFAVGANTGVVNLTAGSTNAAGTVVSSTVTNDRDALVSNGQLYVSTASGTAVRIGTVGTGVSTATGQTLTELPGLPVGTAPTGTAAGTPVAGPYGFAFATLGGGTTPDTLYVADNTNGVAGSNGSSGVASFEGTIDKFSLVNGAYTPEGTVALAGVTGITAEPLTTGGVTTETIFATTASGLYDLSDTSGAAGTLTGTPTLLVTAGANTAFRGLALTPSVASAVPEPTTVGVAAVAAAGLLARRRRRQA